MEQRKMIKFSSSRTEILQLVLLGTGIGLLWWSIGALFFRQNEFFQILILILAMLFAFAEIYVAMNLYSLKIGGYEFEFTSIFRKNIKKHISDINIYGINTYGLTLIDPLKSSKLTMIKLKNNRSLNSILVLNPSTFSSYSDIQSVVRKVHSNYMKEEKDKK